MSDVPSPCVRICQLDENGLCIGCYRTLQEIGQWPRISNAARAAIVAKLPARRALHEDLGARCDNCGVAFHCGAGDTAPCWCAGYPPMQPTSPDARCLCPSCLVDAPRRE